MTSKMSAPFSLLVTLTFTDEEHKRKFLVEDFGPYSTYVKEHEPTTLSYEALQSDQNPLQVLIMERYTDKEVAFLQTHRSTKEFMEFRPKLKEMQDAGFVKVEGSSFYDTLLGFGDRAGCTI